VGYPTQRRATFTRTVGVRRMGRVFNPWGPQIATTLYAGLFEAGSGRSALGIQ
jgi:hypothetical protein